jgi:hypothetical protein
MKIIQLLFLLIFILSCLVFGNVSSTFAQDETGSTDTTTTETTEAGSSVEGDQLRDTQSKQHGQELGTRGSIKYESFTSFPGVGRISTLCELTDALWQLGIIALITAVFGTIVFAGFQYVTAGVNVNGVSEAKQKLLSAVTGLILGLSSILILQVINVDLLNPTCSLELVAVAENPFAQTIFGGSGAGSGGVASGDGDMTLLELARSSSVGKRPDGYCYRHVSDWIEQVGFCGITPEDGFRGGVIPANYLPYARHFADYMNQGGNAEKWGMVNLNLDNPFDAPAGSIVVVRAGSPGTRHPRAGDITVADGQGNFYNGGEMGYGSRSSWPPGNNMVLGVYVCQ